MKKIKQNQTNKPKVAVVGAGFAGIEVVKSLRDEPVEVMLVDRNNYHTFQPLLYQVATAGLEPEAIAWSVRDIFQDQENFRFRMNKIIDVNLDESRLVTADDQEITYDYLILAAGASTDYFNVPGAKEHAFPMKNLMNAVHLKSHIIQQFELVEQNPELIDEGYLNFVIVGGGPTGVETAGALVELFEMVLQKDFDSVNFSQVRVILIEMMPHLLNTYDPNLRSYTLDTLLERDVEVRLNQSVTEVQKDKVKMENGETIPTQSLIWAAGVQANPLAERVDADQTKNGRIDVNADLRIPDQPNSFVVGDMAGAQKENDEFLPQLAPVAIQEAKHASEQIIRLEKNSSTEPFTYDNPGKMATVGINAAVAELPGGIKLSGFWAWVMWVFIHIYKLIGFRNRLLVFFEWVHNYFTYDRTARLILDVIPESDELKSIEEYMKATEDRSGQS